jgi:G:T-mismatch repair DNA endonuclease (very short patch repair protein)
VEKFPADGPESLAEKFGLAVVTVQNIAYKNGVRLKNPRKNIASNPEKRVHKILECFGVDFQAQLFIKPNFIVDIAIGNVIIQIDGDYWHGHHRFEPLTDRQKSQKKRDYAQDRYLSKMGYTVERIWESDISDSAIKEILYNHGITLQQD